MTPPETRELSPADEKAPRRLLDALWLLGYIPLSLAFTWPLAARFTTALAGERDAWQTLWTIDWLRRALGSGQNPFFTHDLWHPDGVTLVFQAFDLPDAIWAAPLVRWLGPWPTYNLAVLWTFVASGMAMYALGRATGASRPASFLSGCAYTFCTYHFAHALAHLTLIAIQWMPLYVLAFWRILERRHWGWAIAGGVFLALAALASWYCVLVAFLLSVGLAIAWLVRTRGRDLLPFIPRAALLCAVFLALIGPLAWQMVRQRASEAFDGSHPASFYSADIESFVLPNAAQALAAWSPRHRVWTGNAGETAEYLGAILIVLVVAGAFLKAPRVGAYLLAGALGIVFSLGPALHMGGRTVTGAVLPYAWAVRAIPLLEFTGMPMRLSFAASFGLAAALAPALDALHRKFSWWILAPLAVLAVLEHAPHAFVTTTLPTPAPMLEWARDPRPFAVLDLSPDNERQEWHQTLHEHPVFGVMLNRTPIRLERKLAADPVIGPLRSGATRLGSAPLRAGRIDFPFNTPIAEGAEPTQFSFGLEGTLHVATAGVARFRLLSDDGAWLSVDGHTVVNDGGTHGPREARGEVPLSAGDHPVKIRYQQLEGRAVLRGWWTPPGAAERPLGGADVPAGFAGTVNFHRRALGVSREAALRHLRDLQVRYIVQPAGDSREEIETQLGLRPIWAGAGVRIYELPGWAVAARGR